MRKKALIVGVSLVLALGCNSCGMIDGASDAIADSVVSKAKDKSTEAPTDAATVSPTMEVTPAATLEPTVEPTQEVTEAPATEPAATLAAQPTTAATQAPSAGGNTKISDNWKDMQFIFDGKKYDIPAAYQQFKDNGWSFDLKDYGYKDGYVLNPGDSVTGTIQLKNNKYNEKLNCSVGFKNNSKKAMDITKCDVWTFSIDTTYGFDKLDNVPDMMIAKGIKIGSTKKEVLAAFGKTDDVYEEKEYGYTTYEYTIDYTYHLRITVYDKVGVTSIEFSDYE